jgi:hypothetical protein
MQPVFYFSDGMGATIYFVSETFAVLVIAME